MNNRMRPIHPGEILREELDTIGLSANVLAHKLHVPTNRVTSILNGQRSITSETAIRLSVFFRVSAEFWMNLQRDYDLKTTRNRLGKKIGRDVEPYDEVA